MELYKHQLKNYQFNIKKTHGSNNGKGYQKNWKCYDIFTFDLENTNAWLTPDGEVIPYHKGETDEYWNELEAIALVYIWQFSVNDTVYYGRELTDFLEVLDDLPKDTELQIFVHNLSHEYVFLSEILTPLDVFARSPHKPMSAIFEEYPKIKFRCSYIMTNLSLANWGESIGFNKKVGQLDYDSKLRTPWTPLDDPKELEYCEYDCLVVYHGILKELETYGDVFSIPLTSTGKIRKVVKGRLFANPNYSWQIKKLVPSIDEYRLLLKCFQGGYCHCNKLHANKIINEDYLSIIGGGKYSLVSHWDFTSS